MKSFKKYLPYIIFLAIVGISLLLVLHVFKNLKKDPFLKVSFLDVGQGDAIFIQAPNKKQFLIDTGRDSKVLEALSKEMPFADRSLDAVVLTHRDIDHAGGLPSVFRNYKVAKIIESDVLIESQNKEVEDFFNNVKSEKFLVSRGTKIYLDEENKIYLEILFPDKSVPNKGLNENSIVSKLVFNKTSFLFTGDANIYSENLIMWVSKEGDIDVDILKLGHHGAKTSSGLLWLEKTSPSLAIISAGKGNTYGHPHKEVLERLEKLKIPYLSTFEKGNIVIKSDGLNFLQK